MASVSVFIFEGMRPNYSARRRTGRLNVFDVPDLVLAHAARGPDFSDVARMLADQRARDRRADRYFSLLDVRLIIADDLVGHDLAVGHFLEFDRRPEYAAAVGIDQRGIDDLRIRELAFDFGDAPLDKALALLGCGVFRVLR